MATCVRQMVIITILLITSLFFLRYFLTDSTSEELLSGNFLPSIDNQQKLTRFFIFCREIDLKKNYQERSMLLVLYRVILSLV